MAAGDPSMASSSSLSDALDSPHRSSSPPASPPSTGMFTAPASHPDPATTLIAPFAAGASASRLNTRIGSQRLLRWPLVILIWTVIIFEFALYLLVRLLVKIYEGVCDACMYVSCRSGRRGRRIRKQLREVRSFDEWCDIARELDRVEGREAWKREDESPYYDFMLLRRSIEDIRACRRSGDFVALTKVLAGVYTRNAAHTSINNQQLYAETNFGTKDLISDFVQEVVEATVLLRDSTVVPHAAKVGFFKQVRTAYGRTALCLSGGATMAYYHFGVVKALIDARCMPAIVSGASGGAMVASWVGVRTDAELAAILIPALADQIDPCCESWWVCLARFVKTGALFDWNLWVDKCRVATLGDTTFEEAFRRTGRILNIPMTSAHKHAQSVVLNYRTAPKVIIWSAVLASSAIPMVLKPVTLHCKDDHGNVVPFLGFGSCFADGSIKNDLPLQQLAEVFNVNYFIVSQCNPHIVPFFFHHRGASGDPSRRGIGLGSRFRGGFISSMLEVALRLEMRKWLQIMGELELLPDFFGQDWRNSLLQVNSGNVTIYPTPRWIDYAHLLSDPTREDMAHYLRGGELSTWPRMCMLNNHYAFERTLIESMQLLDR